MIRKLLACLLILTPLLCCQQKPDIYTIAHPVHADSFMAGKLQSELLEIRKSKDANFKTAADSPIPAILRSEFTGLDYYPIDLRYRFEGPVIRYPEPKKLRMITTSGEPREAIQYGYIRFVLEGQEFRLQVYRLLDLEEKNLLFVPFVDANAPKETYPAGRYIDLVEKRDGLYVIDFNTSYNPSCAYGGSYPCPVTPKENRLSIPIPAGEKNLRIAATIEQTRNK
jgi:uncharacterized protein (DUF1684 family)